MGDRKVFTDSIIPLPEEAGVTKNGLIVNQAKPEHRNDRMALLFLARYAVAGGPRAACRQGRSDIR